MEANNASALFSPSNTFLWIDEHCVARVDRNGTAAFRRPSSAPGGFAEGRLMKKKAKEIGLSEETVAKIDAAIEAGTAEEAKLREQSMAAIGELNEILAQNLPSEKELMAASNKVGENADEVTSAQDEIRDRDAFAPHARTARKIHGVSQEGYRSPLSPIRWPQLVLTSSCPMGRAEVFW